jgi:hypothetical protein
MCTATGCQPNVYCHRVSTKCVLPPGVNQMCTATGCQPNVYCHRVSTKCVRPPGANQMCTATGCQPNLYCHRVPTKCVLPPGANPMCTATGCQPNVYCHRVPTKCVLPPGAKPMCTATGCQPNVYCHRVSTQLQLTNILILRLLLRFIEERTRRNYWMRILLRKWCRKVKFVSIFYVRFEYSLSDRRAIWLCRRNMAESPLSRNVTTSIFQKNAK